MSDGAKIATIGASARVRGRIAGDEDLVVHGRVEGEIDLRGVLRVEAGAVVRASVRVIAARVRGAVVGDIVASDLVHLTSTAQVVGDVRAPRLVIEPGARIAGAAVVEGELRDEGPRRSFTHAEPVRVQRIEPQPLVVEPWPRAAGTAAKASEQPKARAFDPQPIEPVRSVEPEPIEPARAVEPEPTSTAPRPIDPPFLPTELRATEDVGAPGARASGATVLSAPSALSQGPSRATVLSAPLSHSASRATVLSAPSALPRASDTRAATELASSLGRTTVDARPPSLGRTTVDVRPPSLGRATVDARPPSTVAERSPPLGRPTVSARPPPGAATDRPAHRSHPQAVLTRDTAFAPRGDSEPPSAPASPPVPGPPADTIASWQPVRPPAVPSPREVNAASLTPGEPLPHPSMVVDRASQRPEDSTRRRVMVKLRRPRDGR